MFSGNYTYKSIYQKWEVPLFHWWVEARLRLAISQIQNSDGFLNLFLVFNSKPTQLFIENLDFTSALFYSAYVYSLLSCLIYPILFFL